MDTQIEQSDLQLQKSAHVKPQIPPKRPLSSCLLPTAISAATCSHHRRHGHHCCPCSRCSHDHRFCRSRCRLLLIVFVFCLPLPLPPTLPPPPLPLPPLPPLPPPLTLTPPLMAGVIIVLAVSVTVVFGDAWCLACVIVFVTGCRHHCLALLSCCFAVCHHCRWHYHRCFCRPPPHVRCCHHQCGLCFPCCCLTTMVKSRLGSRETRD